MIKILKSEKYSGIQRHHSYTIEHKGRQYKIDNLAGGDVGVDVFSSQSGKQILNYQDLDKTTGEHYKYAIEFIKNRCKKIK